MGAARLLANAARLPSLADPPHRARSLQGSSPRPGGARLPHAGARRADRPGDWLPARSPGSVLVAEDRSIIAPGTKENLKRLGVAGAQLESALADRPPDFAIIDFNLGGESSGPIADALRVAGLRFVLATGYGKGASSFERLGAEAVLCKPYGMTKIAELLAGSGAPSKLA